MQPDMDKETSSEKIQSTGNLELLVPEASKLQTNKLPVKERLKRWPGMRSGAGRLYRRRRRAGGHGGVSSGGSRELGAFRHSWSANPPRLAEKVDLSPLATTGEGSTSCREDP
jgi:hypothetical protein